MHILFARKDQRPNIYQCNWIYYSACLGVSKALRPRSHFGQNLDKFVLISKKSVKFLSSVDQAKCDLLVSTRTKICPWRQIFKCAVLLPRSTTFCEQQTKIVFLVINLPVNSVKTYFFSASHFDLSGAGEEYSVIHSHFSPSSFHPITMQSIIPKYAFT